MLILHSLVHADKFYCQNIATFCYALISYDINAKTEEKNKCTTYMYSCLNYTQNIIINISPLKKHCCKPMMFCLHACIYLLCVSVDQLGCIILDFDFLVHMFFTFSYKWRLQKKKIDERITTVANPSPFLEDRQTLFRLFRGDFRTSLKINYSPNDVSGC